MLESVLAFFTEIPREPADGVDSPNESRGLEAVAFEQPGDVTDLEADAIPQQPLAVQWLLGSFLVSIQIGLAGAVEPAALVRRAKQAEVVLEKGHQLGHFPAGVRA